MSTKQFLFDLLFRADPSQAKAAAQEVRTAVAGVKEETKAATAATQQDTAATAKSAQAKKEAVKAAQEQAKAEEEVRKAGGKASGQTPPAPTPAPVPASSETDTIRARYVPLFAAQKAYQSELEGIAAAEKAQALSQQEASDARARALMSYERMAERINRSDAAMRGNTRTMRLQRHEARMLSLQVTDTWQSFALGMSPMQVLLQQGPQVIDIFGGIGNTLRYMRQSLSGFRVLMGGTTAAVVGGAMAWNQYLGSMKAIEAATTGTGRGIGLTSEQLDLMARSGSDRGNISLSRARDLAAELVGSGRIGAGNVEGLIAMARDFAATNRIKLDEVGPQLVEAFGSPGKTAEQYYATHGLEAVDVEQIQRLEAQNRQYEAQALLIERIRARLVDAGKTKTWFGREFEALGRRWSDIGSGVGETIADLTGSRDAPLHEEIARLEGALARLEKRRHNPADASRLKADLERLYAERDDRDQGLDHAVRKALGNQALDYAGKSPANALTGQESALRNQIAAMKAGLDAPDLSSKQRADIERAIDGQSAALEVLANRRQHDIDLSKLDLQLARERNPLRRAEIAAEKAFMQAAEQVLPLSERKLAAESARRKILTETLAAAAEQSAGMSEEAQALTRLNVLTRLGIVSAGEAASWMERELALRPLLAAAARAEGEKKAELQSEIKKLSTAYDDLNAAGKREFAQQTVQSADKRIAQLRLETSLIGRSNDERIRALAMAPAEEDIRREKLSGADADAVRKAASDEAKAQIEKQRRQRETDLATQQMLDAYDAAARLARDPISRSRIEAQREYAQAIADGASAQDAAARADQVRRRALDDVRASLADLERSQGEQIARLKLEIELAGRSEQVQRRVLALYDAELEIQRMGIDSGGAHAESIRRRAEATEELRGSLERLSDAWDKVGTSTEAAIDGAVDGLLDGDLEGAVSSAKDAVLGLFAELAIKNPLKNAVLGTNYGTLSDVGGLQGIWGRLTGRADPNEITGLKASAMTAAAMTITTPMVTLNARGITGAGLNGIFSSSNTNAMPGALPGAQDVQKQVWDFFSGKGLAPHQVGAIMGNAAGESGFNPFAKGDNGTSFGLFQHHGPRATQLLTRLGGVGGLGNVQGQLEHVWQELMTSENGAFQKLLNTTNVADATNVWMREFERPSDQAMAESWNNRLGAAEAAMTKFTASTGTATQGLGTLGSGFDTFGQSLMQGLSGAGGGGSALTSLIGIGLKAFGIPGFARGGRHAGGLRVVGEDGPELEYTGPSTIIPTDLTRQILTARQGPMVTPAPANVTFAPVIAPINNSSVALDMQVQETTDARGQRRYDLVLSDAVATGTGARGGSAAKMMGSTYGLKRVGINRG